MSKIEKNDIYVRGSFWTRYALAIFFGSGFLSILIPNIDRYIINHKSIGIHFFVSIIFLLIFGFLMVGSYALWASKLYIKGNFIEIKKWYGLKIKSDIKGIDKIVFDKTNGELDAITIYVKNTKILLTDDMIDFHKLVNFINENVDSSKIEYLKMTRKLLKEILYNYGIPEQLYNLNANHIEDNRICLLKEKKQYIVYYKKEEDEIINKSFDEESDALLFILDQFESGNI